MILTVSVNLPTSAEALIRESNPDVAAYARETLAVQMFREEKITHHELNQMLGLDRCETDGLLKRHKVENPLTHEEVNEEVRSLEKLSSWAPLAFSFSPRDKE